MRVRENLLLNALITASRLKSSICFVVPSVS